MVDINPINPQSITVNVPSNGSLTVNNPGGSTAQVSTNADAQLAYSWACGVGLIQGIDYSAKYWAGKAKESELIAVNAIQDIEDAKDDAIAELESAKDTCLNDIELAGDDKIAEIEGLASDYESTLIALTTRAETAAARAESEATTAYLSASAANFSKNAAAESATSAATNANLAENYKNDAYTYANSAASSKNAAKSYADNANEDMERALNAAAEARTSANSASQSATTATNAKNAAESARDAAGNYAQQAEQAKDDIEAELDSYVQTSRQINGKDLTNDITLTSADIGALADTTKYGYSIALSLNTTDYKLTLTLKDQDGTTLSTKTVDFPIESVVVNGSYDSTNQKIVLTLQNGNTIDIPVGDLISGLQSEITSTNMLDSDLVDDTNATNKFVSANEKTTWNNKQNAISDLSTIRTNATNGANAYTIISGYGDIVTHNSSEFVTPSGLTTVLADYVLSSDLSTTLADYVTSTSLTTILDDYATEQWVQTNANALYSAMQTWVQNQGYALSSNLATVATSGSYNDLVDKPYIPSGVVVDQTFDGTSQNAQSGVAIEGKLANYVVKHNGNCNIYNNSTDIEISCEDSSEETENKLVIDNSEVSLIYRHFGNNSAENKLTVRDDGIRINTLSNGTFDDTTLSVLNGNLAVNGSEVALKTDIPTVPTNVSAFTNDAGYLTSIPSRYLQNIATGSDSLSLLGTSSSENYSINIGRGTSIKSSYQIAIGYSAKCESASNNGAIAIGGYAAASAIGAASLAIGHYAKANNSADIAIGYEAICTSSSCIQIGYGTNSTANTLSIGFYNDSSTHYNWQLLDGTTGLIPDARISTNIARASQIITPTYDSTNERITW